MKRFIFYSPLHFEKWDWRNSIERGIGGSETSHVEMSWRLARRGHEVISYAPVPDDCPGIWRNTKWFPLPEVNWNVPGIWILYRCPQELDNFQLEHPEQEIWLMCQDEDYPGGWNEKRAKKVDKVFALCKTHAYHLARNHPEIKDKIFVTSNGVKMDLIREVAKDPPKRNPKKLIFASSPDRGLINLIKIFKRAKEYVPDLELHAFYGLDNIEKLIKYDKRFSHYEKFKKDLLALTETPGVFWRGRISQKDLYGEWLSAGIWCYPTNFSETSCITSMEAQCLGAIPITNPYWALGENVKHGIFVEGDAYCDELVRARYAGEIVRLALNPELQDEIRQGMIDDSRCRFNWERYVDQWEGWSIGKTMPGYTNQFAFQIKHMSGKTLNVGCDNDLAGLKLLGAMNMDAVRENPVTKIPTQADVIMDIRNPQKSILGIFDSVILGDILEHMTKEDAIKALKNAKLALRNGGRVIVTCPNDFRPIESQHRSNNGHSESYLPGISAYHTKPISKEDIFDMINQSGLKPKIYQELDYTHFVGHGVVAV